MLPWFSAEEADKLTVRIQNAGTEVVEAKAGAGEPPGTWGGGAGARRPDERGLCTGAAALAGWPQGLPRLAAPSRTRLPHPTPPHPTPPPGSATLSMAYAAARMAESVLLGLAGEPGVVECTFVESALLPDFPFFASKVGRQAGSGGWAGNWDARGGARAQVA